MASAFSHAVAALALGACFYQPAIPKRVWLAGAVCATLPDLDVIGFAFDIRYEDFLGHRGFTHSLLFAALLAAAVTGVWFRNGVSGLSVKQLWLYLFLAIASHGVLDAFTNGGLGVAFFAPFNNTRYFFPWTPIEVSPIGIDSFFSQRGWQVIQNELVWIWLPAALFTIFVLGGRHQLRRLKADG